MDKKKKRRKEKRKGKEKCLFHPCTENLREEKKKGVVRKKIKKRRKETKFCGLMFRPNLIIYLVLSVVI